MMKVRSTPSCALVAVACLGCFARSTTGFVVGPTTAARRVVNPCNVGASNSFSVSCASRSPSHFTGTSLSPLVVQSHVGAAHGIVAAGYGARQLSMMSTEAKKTVIITGASSGIGFEAARALTGTGEWHVIMAVRSFAKAEAAAKGAGMDPKSYTVMDLDLASLQSTRMFAKAVKAAGIKPDALVCNAAVWYPKDKNPRSTADGFEEAVGVNHLGHFLLCNLLLDDLKKSRVVFIGTETHNPGSIAGKIPPQAHLGDLEGLANGEPMIDGLKFEPTKAYKDSKVCNVLMMREMDKRFSGEGMVVSALFPGCIAESPLFRDKRGWFRTLFPLFQKYVTRQFVSTEEAGRRVAEVVSSPQFSTSGAYWRWNGQDAEATVRENVVSDEAMDDARCEKLWDISAKLVGI